MPRLRELLLFILLAGLAGCQNCDLVEAELRTRNNDLRELKSDLYRLESENEALVQELQTTRPGMTGGTPADHSFQSFAVRQITLGRQTGGYNRTDRTDHDALQVVVEPRDGDGHAIKAPGTLHVEAYDITAEGLKSLCSTWDIHSEQLRRSWHSGLWSSGYTLVLPWQNWPTTERIRVLVRFTGTDGRTFEADKDANVRITPVSRRQSLLPEAPAMEIPVPAPATLPPPRKLDGPSISKAWWQVPPATPHASAVVTQTAQWVPKAQPPLNESVELLAPIAIAERRPIEETP